MSGGQPEILIIGAGPAGLSAAIYCAEQNIKTNIFDDKPSVGGAIFSQPKGGALANSCRDKTFFRGKNLLQQLERHRSHITVSSSCEVVGYFPEQNEIAYLQDGKLSKKQIDRLIICTGCYERAQPFPGWTLPSVMTLGGAQLQVKTGLVKPGRSVVLVGTGPLLPIAAKQFLDAGIEVKGIFESGRRRHLLSGLPSLLANVPLLYEGLKCLQYIARHGLKIRYGWGIVEAIGGDELEEVVVAPYDLNWTPILSRAVKIETDCLAVGYGFIPRTELTQLLGCEHRFCPENGFVAVVDDWMRTSKKNIYAAGDGVGVYGSEAAAAQGRLAAIACLMDAGVTLPTIAATEAKNYHKEIGRHRRFRKGFSTFSRLRNGLLDLPRDETVICRCEGVTLQDIRRSIRKGAQDLLALKMSTRVGMGDCQGKMCGPYCRELIKRKTTKSDAEIGSFRPRFPLSPVPFSAMDTPHE